MAESLGDYDIESAPSQDLSRKIPVLRVGHNDYLCQEGLQQEIQNHLLLLKTQSMFPSLVFSLMAKPLGSLAVSALPDSPPTVCVVIAQ